MLPNTVSVKCRRFTTACKTAFLDPSRPGYPLEKASLNYRSIAKCRGPLAVGMQGSLVVELDCDVSAKTKTYSRKKKNRAKRNCTSLQGTSSKKQVKAEQASKAPHEYGKHLSHPRSVFRIPGTASRCLSVELGFRMSIVSGIPDS